MNTTVKRIIKTIAILCAACAPAFAQQRETSRDYYLHADQMFRGGHYETAYGLLQKIRSDEIDKASWEEVHFRLGECAFRTGDWAKAVEYLHTFVDNCDAKKYGDVQFRSQALDFLAGSFAGMPNGTTEAANFFKKKPGKTYEAQTVFAVGAKLREREKWDEAIAALDRAVKTYPTYKSAPDASLMLIECYAAKKDDAKMNAERDRFVKDYAPGGKWHQANSGSAELLKRADAESRRVLGETAVYYYRKGEETGGKAHYDNALKRFEEFIKKYPDDKWMTLEFRYRMADTYNAMGDCEKAAHNYYYIATEDISKYPPKPFAAEINVDQEDAAYNSVAALLTCRNNEMNKSKLTEQAMYSRASTKQFIERGMDFHKRFPKNENVPDILLLIGVFHYSGRNLDEARKTFRIVIDKYPKSDAAGQAKQQLEGIR